MQVRELVKALEEEESRLFNKTTVLQLSTKDVSEFKRGKISGQIELLNRLKKRLQNDTKTV